MVCLFNYSEEKNLLLKATRRIGFDDVIEAIRLGKLIDDVKHPNLKRGNQRIYVVKINNYAYAVPYVLDNQKQEVFLKTIYPSRLLTKHYLKGRKK